MQVILVITMTMHISLAKILPVSDNLRDVRELFARDIVSGGGVKLNNVDIDTGIRDPIKGIQSFVTKVVSTPPSPKDIGELEVIIEKGFVEEYPSFEIDVNIVTEDLDDGSDTLDLSFNIRY